MYLLQLASADDGLTFREILADIPHDAAAIFVYLLIAASIIVIWRANRRKAEPPAAGRKDGGPSDPAGPGPRTPANP